MHTRCNLPPSREATPKKTWQKQSLSNFSSQNFPFGLAKNGDASEKFIPELNNSICNVSVTCEKQIGFAQSNPQEIQAREIQKLQKKFSRRKLAYNSKKPFTSAIYYCYYEAKCTKKGTENPQMHAFRPMESRRSIKFSNFLAKTSLKEVSTLLATYQNENFFISSNK